MLSQSFVVLSYVTRFTKYAAQKTVPLKIPMLAGSGGAQQSTVGVLQLLAIKMLVAILLYQNAVRLSQMLSGI